MNMPDGVLRIPKGSPLRPDDLEAGKFWNQPKKLFDDCQSVTA
jgi:hypothetical protein